MDKNKFTIIDESGEEKSYDILFTFDSDETKKQYIVYTDHSKTEEGTIRVFASTYVEDDGGTSLNLTPIESEKEWNIIETILKSLEEEINKPESM